MTFVRVMAAIAFLVSTQAALAADEVSLFDGQGKATAYIAVSDGLTIYLWSGEPVAYLDPDSQGGYNVYGFNGNHLGWFLNDVIWDHSGNASCADKAAMQTTELEPLKSLKQLKPLKAIEEIAPVRPVLTNSFGNTPCAFLLGSGAEQ